MGEKKKSKANSGGFKMPETKHLVIGAVVVLAVGLVVGALIWVDVTFKTASGGLSVGGGFDDGELLVSGAKLTADKVAAIRGLGVMQPDEQILYYQKLVNDYTGGENDFVAITDRRFIFSEELGPKTEISDFPLEEAVALYATYDAGSDWGSSLEVHFRDGTVAELQLPIENDEDRAIVKDIETRRQAAKNAAKSAGLAGRLRSR